MENKDFDELIRRGLEDFESESQAPEGDWGMMEEMLAEDERAGKELLYIKGFEAVLVILAIFTLFRFIPDYSQNTDPFANTEEIPVADASDWDTPKVPETKTTEPSDIDSKTEIQTLPIDSTPTRIKSSSGETNIQQTSDIKETTSFQKGESQEIRNVVLRGQALGEIAEGTIATIPKPFEINLEEILSGLEMPEIPEELFEAYQPKTEHSLFSRLTPSSAGPLAYDWSKEKISGSKISKFRIGAQTGIELNQILSPYSKETESSFSTLDFGYSAGVNFAWKKGLFEIETGLGYGHTSYKPAAVFEVTGTTTDGFVAETLSDISFHTFRVPLTLRFYINNSPTWKFYATGGATTNLVAWSNYDRAKYDVEDLKDPDAIASRPPAEVDIQNAGILNGEAFKDNFYITADLGFGVERSLGKSTAIFAQPVFSYHLIPSTNGLGPNKDRFNALSLNFGLRKNL